MTQTEENQQRPVQPGIMETLYQQLMKHKPELKVLYQHPGFRAYLTYLTQMRQMYSNFIVYGPVDIMTPMKDSKIKGIISFIDEQVDMFERIYKDKSVEGAE